MNEDFWKNSWKVGNLGFHQMTYNSDLVEFLDSFSLPKTPRTFVPLCGKSSDMIFLMEKGHHVFGVELSEIAAESFFRENKINYKVKKMEQFSIYHSQSLEIFCGNLFELKNAHLGKIDFIYDRASNVALPPEMRKSYYDKLSELSSTGTKFFIINFEYNAEVDGPPFSVHYEEVFKEYSSRFKGDFSILAEKKEKTTSTKFLNSGVTHIISKLIKIEKLG